MKKDKESELNDWGKPEYKRSDLGELVRGKYIKRIRESTNVVLLDAEVAKVFPNDEAVNEALRRVITRASKNKRRAKRKSKLAESKRAA